MHKYLSVYGRSRKISGISTNIAFPAIIEYDTVCTLKESLFYLNLVGVQYYKES